MGIVAIIAVGLLVGALAKLLMPGPDPGGLIITALLGIAGSAVAGLIGRLAGFYRTSWSGPGLIASALGGMMLLYAYRLIRRT